jgi:hypothetical protein
MPSRTISREFRTVIMQQLSSRILLHCWPNNICTISYRLSTISLLPWWYVICYHIVTLLITIALVVCYLLLYCYLSYHYCPDDMLYFCNFALLMTITLMVYYFYCIVSLLITIALMVYYLYCIVSLLITIALMICYIFLYCYPFYHYCPDDMFYFFMLLSILSLLPWWCIIFLYCYPSYHYCPYMLYLS